MAWHLAGLAAHAQGTPCHTAQGWKEGDGKAPLAHGPDGALSRQLQEGRDSMHPVSRHVRAGTVAEGGPRPGNRRSGRRTAAAGQPRGTGDNRLPRTTNLGALSMESELRAATTQLENRQRRFGLCLLGLPRGDRAREVPSGQCSTQNSPE